MWYVCRECGYEFYVACANVIRCPRCGHVWGSRLHRGPGAYPAEQAGRSVKNEIDQNSGSFVCANKYTSNPNKWGSVV